MTLLLVLLLAVLWGAVFLPAILRARLDSSPIVSVGMFRRGMRALSGSHLSGQGGRWVLMPRTPEDGELPRKRALMRRRRMFAALLAGSLVTLVLGIFPGLHGLLKLHVALDCTLAGYVLYLVQTKPQRAEGKPARPQVLDEEREYLRAGHF